MTEDNAIFIVTIGDAESIFSQDFEFLFPEGAAEFAAKCLSHASGNCVVTIRKKERGKEN